MAKIRHGTLVPNTVTTVTLSGLRPSDHVVEVLNRSGTAEIFFRVDGTAPTVGGDDCEILPASISGVEVDIAGKETTVVKLISTGAMGYTVRVG